jgi:NodT family efflux transporter outer membrane factor (OMF) lipoprotein
MSRSFRIPFVAFAAIVLTVSLTGCDEGLRNYVRKGFKVGPDYCKPDAPVAEHWINETDVHAVENPDILRNWWTVFKDPKLNELIVTASHQNLTLREAGFRVLQARYTLAIARGDLFPQLQTADGSFSRNAAAITPNSAPSGFGRYYDNWDFGFNMQWELDFWGRFRRAVTAAEDSLDASVDNYDYVMVTMLGDIATDYVTVRTAEKQIKLAQANVELQRGVADWVQKRKTVGYKQYQLDLDQAIGTLRATEATIPALEITRQQAEDALCVLMGTPTVDLRKMLGEGPIPPAPVNAIVGIPADLLRRRPDVLAAERNAAAQAEQIGIAKSDLYPAFYIDGSLGYTAANFPDLFKNTAFNGSIGPSFQWNVLNYGRIVNNVRFQDAKFQELVATYQQAVLTANQGVEDGMATYLRSQQQAKLLDESVVADTDAVRIAIVRYKAGSIDFNTYVTIAQNLVVQQNAAAQARGQIATGLIAVYRALGGGWELKCEEESPAEPAATEMAPGRIEEAEEMERVPAPLPTVPEEPATAKKPDEPKELVPAKKPDAAKKATATPKASDATEKSAEPKEPADKKSEPATKEGASALKIDNMPDEPSTES